MSLSDKLMGMSVTLWERRPEILLGANTVKPLHGVVPRIILGQKWWDQTRFKAYRSTVNHCIACGVYKKEAKERPFLEGHEVYQIDYPKGRQTYIETVPLCHYCHNFIHDGRMGALVNKGEMDPKKMEAVIDHGNEILKKAKLKRKPYLGKCADWGDWRLVLFSKEYPPLYKNYQEWERGHGYGTAKDDSD